jgi:C4-dicarboxylate transporter, DctM subunit
MSEIAIPKMIKARYPETLAAGLVTSSTGTLDVPPSIPLILYGINTENSIEKLLIEGILPGLLIIFLFSLFVVSVGIKQIIKTEKYSRKERWLSLKEYMVLRSDNSDYLDYYLFWYSNTD